MNADNIHLWLGVVLVVAGGAMLAFWREPAGAAVGSTCGLAGLLLIGWAWFNRRK